MKSHTRTSEEAFPKSPTAGPWGGTQKILGMDVRLAILTTPPLQNYRWTKFATHIQTKFPVLRSDQLTLVQIQQVFATFPWTYGKKE